MLVVMAKKGVWVLEQPASSIVMRLKRFQQLLRKTTAACLKLYAKCLYIYICRYTYSKGSVVLLICVRILGRHGGVPVFMLLHAPKSGLPAIFLDESLRS